jgi:hypothetical protein
MIGTSFDGSILDPSNIIIARTISTYNGESYVPVDVTPPIALSRNKGYWIKTNQQGTIQLLKN